MNIKDVLINIDSLPLEQFTNKQYISNIKIQKNDLSTSDIRLLSKEIGDFRNSSPEHILKCILLFSFWQPDKAIEVSRKKGVFRYKAWGVKNNVALYLLQNIKKYSSVIEYSDKTLNFIDNKINISWLFDFYKKAESKIVAYIKKHHSTRLITKIDGVYVEEALFKELLAYVDITFYNYKDHQNPTNKNKLESYGLERIAESISYIVYLYDKTIGIKKDKIYNVVPDYVLSNEIEHIILLGCKISQIQEWEICLDYFGYQLKKIENSYVISSHDPMLEKSIRLGFARTIMQEQVLYIKEGAFLKNVPSIKEMGDYTIKESENTLIETVGTGKNERYRIKIPEIVIDAFVGKDDALFLEEMLELSHCANELIVPIKELSSRKVTANCSLRDVLSFKRFFVVMNIIAEELLFKQKNKKKIVYSLIPGFNYDSLKKLLSKFVGNATKAEELLQMFTYKKSFKLDLQYTPFLKVGESYFTSISLAARSNLIRNCIAYSYLSGNQIVNKDDKEWLVQKCNTVFKVNHPEYEVFINSNFNYNKQHGEIDALVVGENDLFIIECKCPLLPTNNFELRSSYDHLLKASKQLDLSKAALMDKAFRNNYLKGLGVIEKGRNIHTCIIMGNRLFNGYSMNNHPIRYIHELDMLLNRGLIDSEVGSWRVWENKNFSNSDLLTFLSPNYKLAQANFASMEDTEEFMFIDGKKIYFKTYRYNILKAFKGYDECFAIESRDEKLFEDLLQCTSLE